MIAAIEASARMVDAAYAALDLFAGQEDNLVSWARELPAAGPVAGAIPANFDRGSGVALVAALADAEVAGRDYQIDPVRVLQFREAVEMLPHFRGAEARRVPPQQPRVIFTLPEAFQPGIDEGHLPRSLTVGLARALGSAQTEPILLASPFWSLQGTAVLRPALERAVQWRLPITLAGATAGPVEEYDHLGAMLAFANQLVADGGSVTALEYRPTDPTSRFHAKLACGRVGYLGSANFTNHAFGRHVEAGVTLAETDVARVWWLIGALGDNGFLVEARLS